MDQIREISSNENPIKVDTLKSVIEKTFSDNRVLGLIGKRNGELSRLTEFLSRQMQEREISKDSDLVTETTVSLFPEEALPVQAFLTRETGVFLEGGKGERLNQALIVAKLSQVYRDYSIEEISKIDNLVDFARDNLADRWYKNTYIKALDVLKENFPNWSKGRFNVDSQKKTAELELTQMGIDTNDLVLVGSHKTIVSIVAKALFRPSKERNNPWNEAEIESWRFEGERELTKDFAGKIVSLPDIMRVRVFANSLQTFVDLTEKLSKRALKVRSSLWDYDGETIEGRETRDFVGHVSSKESKGILDHILRFYTQTPLGNVRYGAIHINHPGGREWQILLNNKHITKAALLSGLLVRNKGDTSFIGVPKDVLSGIGHNARHVSEEISKHLQKPQISLRQNSS